VSSVSRDQQTLLRRALAKGFPRFEKNSGYGPVSYFVTVVLGPTWAYV